MRRQRRRVVPALTAVGLAAVVLAEWVSLGAYARVDGDNVAGQLIHDALPATVYLVAGIAAMHARPESRIGFWLWLAGVLTFTGNFGNALVPGLSQLSIGLQDIYLVPMGIVILTYPMGRLDSPPVRWLIGLAVIQIVAVGLFVTASLDPADCAPGWCPANPFLLIRDGGTVAAVNVIGQVTGGALWLAMALIVARRYLVASGTARRLLLPVWIAGLLLAASGVASLVVETVRGPAAQYAYDYWVGWVVSMVPPVVFLAGLLRQRLDRAGIATFVEELANGITVGSLRDAFARLVGDPTLVLAFRMDDGGYADAQGTLVDPSAEGEGRMVTSIERGGREIAVAITDPALQTDPAMLRAAAAAAGLALDNERLTAEVRARVEAIRTSRARLVEAADAERVRIERMLHDGAQQRLVALALRVRALAAGTDEPAVSMRLDALGADLDEALAELRDLARGIHPAVLVQAGLAAALAALAERSPLPVLVDVPDIRLPAPIESTAYYVAAEALTNATRHARATSVTISAWLDGATFHMTVLDDGVGGADPRHGSGLAGLEDRVAASAGSLTVGGGPHGGTLVEIRLPIRQPTVAQPAS